MTRSEPVTIVLSGIGGYGEVYLAALLDEPEITGFRIAGAVDPAPGRCRRLDELRERGIRIFSSLEEFYRTERADIAVLSSPIQLHAPQTCQALEAGSFVLCEKPAAATVEDVDLMLATSRRTGHPVVVGYQWSFTESIQSLKKDILTGVYGAPRRLKSLCLWPRDAAYYGRNDWAGRLRDANGAWIMDGPANNAMAHDLHNMLYVLGDTVGASARPANVTAELYRANDIESYDTAALRVVTDTGVEVLFYGSHAIPESYGPVFHFEFSGGTVSFAGGKDPIRGVTTDGKLCEYTAPDTEPHARKLWTCLRAVITGESDPAALICPLEAARTQTVCINGAHASVPEPAPFPAGLIRDTGDGAQRLRWVDGLDETLRRCYEQALLPGELGVKWARPGKTVFPEK